MAAQLPPFEGTPVISCSVQITKAGDGLSESLEVDPIVLHMGDEGYILMKYRTAKVNHFPVKPTVDELVRQHTLVCQEITFVDESFAAGHLAEAAERVKVAREARKRAEEAEAGIGRLPDDVSAEEARVDHSDGKHTSGLVPGCPTCDDEAAALAEEARADAATAEPTPIGDGKPRRNRGKASS